MQVLSDASVADAGQRDASRPDPGDGNRLGDQVDTSPRAQRDASRLDRRATACRWCERPIPSASRRDALHCSTRCRQAAHRFHRGRALRVADGHPLRLAYADPPYPGKAGLYRDHPDFAGEVDHRQLIARLVAEFPDGWALSTSAEALPAILASCPTSVRVAAWVRGERPTVSYRPLAAWEPVIYSGGRAYLSTVDARRVDALVHVARARLTDPRRVIGAKPAAFCWWLFDLLGALPGDDLVDLFPGSGGVSRAWEALNGGLGPASPKNDALRATRTPGTEGAGVIPRAREGTFDPSGSRPPAEGDASRSAGASRRADPGDASVAEQLDASRLQLSRLAAATAWEHKP